MSAENPADLDELKLAWQVLGRRVERQHALERAVFKRARLLDVRSTLRTLVAGELVQAILGALLVVGFASYWAEQRSTPHLLLLGVVGQLWSLALVGFALRDIATVSRMDYATPVLVLQRRIAELRARRVRVAAFYAVTGCFMWIPASLVVARSLAGPWLESPEVAAGMAWAERRDVVSVLVAGLVVASLALPLLWSWLRSPARARLKQRVDDELVGRSVLRAESMLAEIAEFERE